MLWLPWIFIPTGHDKWNLYLSIIWLIHNNKYLTWNILERSTPNKIILINFWVYSKSWSCDLTMVKGLSCVGAELQTRRLRVNYSSGLLNSCQSNEDNNNSRRFWHPLRREFWLLMVEFFMFISKSCCNLQIKYPILALGLYNQIDGRFNA